MHDEFDALRREDAVEGRDVGEPSFVELHPGRHRGAVAVGEIIKDDGGVTRRQQLANAMTPDVSGTAGDEHFHVPDLYCVSISDG